MDQKTLKIANELNHDVKILHQLWDNQNRNLWLGFRIPGDQSVDALRNMELIKDFDEFIRAECKKAEKMLEEL